MRTALLLLLSLSTLLPGQRVPDPVDNQFEIQIHDVRKVLAGLGPRQGQPIPGFTDAELEAAADAVDRQLLLTGLVTIARRFVTPRLRDHDELESLGGELVILRGLPVQQVSLRRLLAFLERSQLDELEIDCRLLRVPAEVFEEAIRPVLDWHEHAAGSHVILRGERKRLLEAALAENGLEPVVFPTQSLKPTRLESLAKTETVYYRKDYAVEVDKDEVVKWPITGQLEEGFQADLRAAPIRSGTVGVVVESWLGVVERPIPTFETKIGVRGEPVVVDLPNMTIRRLDAAFELAPRELAVVVGSRAADGGRPLLLVSATAVVQMLKMPDGTEVRPLNGVKSPVRLQWPEGRPYSRVTGTETDGGVEYYVHADGSRTTTKMVERAGLDRFEAITIVQPPPR